MKEFLVCIDSDGAAIDAMTIKHKKAFGPVFVETFELNEYKEDILNKWNDLNLYKITRGINRFKGLYEIMKYVIQNYKKIDGFESYEEWINRTSNFSNDSIKEEIKVGNNNIFKKVLKWSEDLNSVIKNIPEDEIKAFENAKTAIKKISTLADIAIISSANGAAVKSEWNREGLMDYVAYVCTQEMGTKEHCIGEVLKKDIKKKKP